MTCYIEQLMSLDLSEFIIKDCVIGGEKCQLITPNHIGVSWTPENVIYRSSIWTKDGFPVSLSFKKFVNWGEKPEVFPTPESLDGCELIEKLDGSTLIVSEFSYEGIIRTRGTCDASKMENGHEIDILKKKYPRAFLPIRNTSFIYEWVSPQNKIILNYGDEPDIYLIGVINHKDYSLWTQPQLDELAKVLCVKRPRRYSFDSIADMLAIVKDWKGIEGLCIYSNNGQTIHKVKADDYLLKHRMKSTLNSFDHILDLYLLNEPSYEELCASIEKIDYELLVSNKLHIDFLFDIKALVDKFLLNVNNSLTDLRKMPRKEAALKIIRTYENRASFVFSLLDGKSLTTCNKKKLYESFMHN